MGDSRTGKRRAAGTLAAVAVTGWAAVGCGTAGERPMTAGMFMPPSGTAPAVATAADLDGSGGPDPAMATAAQPARAAAPPDAEEASPKRAMILTPEPERFESVRPLAPLQPTTPTTAPAEQPAADVVPRRTRRRPPERPRRRSQSVQRLTPRPAST